MKNTRTRRITIAAAAACLVLTLGATFARQSSDPYERGRDAIEASRWRSEE